MNEIEPDELDRMLGQWAERRTCPDEHLAHLHERVSASLDDDMVQMLDELPVERKRVVRWRMVAVGSLASLSAALLLLITFNVGWFGGSDGNDPPPEFAWLNDAQIEQKRVLLAELDRLFDNRLAWAVETHDGLQLGLEENDAVDLQNAKPLAVRVVVVSRKIGQRDWRPIWEVDVMTRNEQVVRVTPDSDRQTQMAIWTEYWRRASKSH